MVLTQEDVVQLKVAYDFIGKVIDLAENGEESEDEPVQEVTAPTEEVSYTVTECIRDYKERGLKITSPDLFFQMVKDGLIERVKDGYIPTQYGIDSGLLIDYNVFTQTKKPARSLKNLQVRLREHGKEFYYITFKGMGR